MRKLETKNLFFSSIVVNKEIMIASVLATAQGINIKLPSDNIKKNKNRFTLFYLLVHGVHAHCRVPGPLEQQAKCLSPH